jgi:hypothetical protein
MTIQEITQSFHILVAKLTEDLKMSDSETQSFIKGVYQHLYRDFAIELKGEIDQKKLDELKENTPLSKLFVSNLKKVLVEILDSVPSQTSNPNLSQTKDKLSQLLLLL